MWQNVVIHILCCTNFGSCQQTELEHWQYFPLPNRKSSGSWRRKRRRVATTTEARRSMWGPRTRARLPDSSRRETESWTNHRGKEERWDCARNGMRKVRGREIRWENVEEVRWGGMWRGKDRGIKMRGETESEKNEFENGEKDGVEKQGRKKIGRKGV
jgi:hypothetical protein